MKYLIITLICLFTINKSYSQNYSYLNEDSKSLKHLVDLLMINGLIENKDQTDSLEILINHGYVVGFSKKHNQPRWVAYQVSKEKKGSDYQRFPYFTNDSRLDSVNQIGNETFGNGYDLGHMAPNSALNKQFGRIGQMETFLMSNISPQKGNLNRGIWVKLESKILNDYPYMKNTPYVWVIVGPVFSNTPDTIMRKNSTIVSIPESFFCIIVKPFRYPYDQAGNSNYMSFLFPQDVPRNENLDEKYLTTIKEIEDKTLLKFFPNFSETMENRIKFKKEIKLW
jgi:endonuclease G